MTDQSQSRAGGIFIVLAILIGVVIGIVVGQPSAGVVGGTLVGAAIAIGVWLRDRRRIGR